MTDILFLHTPIIILLIFVLGTVVGSFLNVCIYRMPMGESVVFPASHCPECRTRLRWYDLAPLISQVLLRGRCRYCRLPVSWRYFFVESLTGILFALTGRYADSLFSLGANLVLVACLIAIFFVDLDHFIIPDELSLTPAAVGLLADFIRIAFMHASPGHIVLPWAGEVFSFPVPTSILGLIVGSGTLLGVGWLGTRMFHKESMGGGDVKLAGAIGAYFGFTWHLLTFFLVSVILGALVGIILMSLRKKTGNDYIPFGPMLVVGAIVVLFWGQAVTPLVVSVYSIH